jgi:3-oxoacyl-(acyl-carrier-protein) synthase
MLALSLYIHSAGVVAPEAAPEIAVTRLSALEPDYTGVIPPMQLRRMSKTVRMGIGAAKACLDRAGIESPDAIAVGTTMGCLQDTEVFLAKLVKQEERMLTPTAFIQSTHNTVAGQIALVTGCKGYNTTISQRGHSFEGAVVATALYLTEHPEHSVLCGGVDELTDTSFHLLQRAGVYTAEAYAPGEMPPAQKGAIAGEGAGFLLLNGLAEGAMAKISGLSIFSEMNAAGALQHVQHSMATANADPASDALWLGVSGNGQREAVYQILKENWGDNSLMFKARSGEWGTVIATAVCRAVLEWPEGKDRIWIVNHYGREWSVWLLER